MFALGARQWAEGLAGGKVAATPCALGVKISLPPSGQAAVAPAREDVVFIRQPCSRNAEPRHSKRQPLTGMPTSRAFCYASSLWSPLPATEKEIKEKLNSASYLCTSVSFLSFFLFISDNWRGSKTQRELLGTNGSLLHPQPGAPPEGWCTIAWSSRPLKNGGGGKSCFVV